MHSLMNYAFLYLQNMSLQQSSISRKSFRRFTRILKGFIFLHIPPPANILFYFLAFQFFHYLYPIQPYIQLDFAKGQRRNTIRDSGIGKTYTQHNNTQLSTQNSNITQGVE